MENFDINIKGQVLYVLKMIQMDENENPCYVIKFGYTKNFKNRYNQYKGYHQTVKILHLYSGGTIDDETRIKQHLKDYILFGDEWFRCCPEVLEFFDTNDTYEKLKIIIPSLPPTKSMNERNHHKSNYNIIEYIINNKFSHLYGDLIAIQDKRDELCLELRDYSHEKQIKYACITYQIPEEDLRDYLQNIQVELKNINITPELRLMLEEFNSIKDTVQKLKLLVEFGECKDLKEGDLDCLFQLIPSKYKDYYTLMGPDRIKANSYQESKLKEEWKKSYMPEDYNQGVEDAIYKTFTVGSRYTNDNIKSTLKEIYQKEGYNKTAKAKDLESYFGLKKVYITSLKSNGFEILYKKDLVKR